MSRYIQKAGIRYALWTRSAIKKNGEALWVERLAIREALKKLPKREEKIIRMRFYEGKTQMEAAKELAISQAQISRIEKAALKSMRSYLTR